MESNFFPAPEQIKAETAPQAAQHEVDRLLDQGNRLLHSGIEEKIAEAIVAFDKAHQLDARNGKVLFSLGAAYRARYDSSLRKQSDFKNAARCWTQALDTKPNQYVWRRRIQQYGPRQIKRYPFYDWIEIAQQEIQQRGDRPVTLAAPLTEAELAKPKSKFTASKVQVSNPDPQAKVPLDEARHVRLNTVVVPAEVQAGKVVRVYLNVWPTDVKWNHEAGPMKVWLDRASEGTPETRLIEFKPPADASTSELRVVEFEFLTAEGQLKSQIDGYVLFDVCDQEGVCYHLRKNFSLTVPLKPADPPRP